MKIDLTGDYYEDAGIGNLLGSLYEKLPKFFLSKNYGNNDVRVFMVIVCDPKKLELRKRYDSMEGVLYWDVILDYKSVKNAKKIEKQLLLAKNIISSFDILDSYNRLGLNKEKIKVDAKKYFISIGWL